VRARSALAASLAVLIAAAAPRPARAAPCDGDEALATVRALCAALAAAPTAATDAAAKTRVKLPLRVRRIASEGAGNPRFRTRFLRSLRSLRAAGLCDGAELDRATVSAEDAEQLVAVPRGQFEVVFSLVRGRARGAAACVVFRVDDR
jgi:hypothetical protein